MLPGEDYRDVASFVNVMKSCLWICEIDELPEVLISRWVAYFPGLNAIDELLACFKDGFSRSMGQICRNGSRE